MYVAEFGPSLIHESHFHDFYWVPHEHAVACSQTLHFLSKVERFIDRQLKGVWVEGRRK